MSYTLDYFRSLVEKYTTWNELKDFLSSEEGGNLRVTNDSGRYCIIRYVKGTSSMTSDSVRWFRSVIWDTVENRPVCVAPPKASSSLVPTGDDLTVEEFIDGTMINVFVTRDSVKPIVCTRTIIGAGNKFYSNKSFSELFNEATDIQNIATITPVPTEATIQATFASFVLQHPENRIVAPCRSPHIWLVHRGSVDTNGIVTIQEDFNPSTVLKTLILPRLALTKFASQEELAIFAESSWATKGWRSQGIVLKDGKGNRWRVRNPNFTMVRTIRGSEAKPLDRFLRLRSSNLLKEYLRYFTEDRDAFWMFEQRLRDGTQAVYQGYCDVHKSRTRTLEQLAWSVKPCVFKLHAHYLENLRAKGETIKMQDAVALVNNMTVWEQHRLVSAPSLSPSSKAPLEETTAGTPSTLEVLEPSL